VNKSKEPQGPIIPCRRQARITPRTYGPDKIVDRGEAELGPLLLTAKQAAAMCGKSLRTWRTWDAAGWIPRPVRIGRSTLWRVDELREWIAAGCPRRAEWEARQ
jgi:predicted DNA-binding transcriptional regulator AlpA